MLRYVTEFLGVFHDFLDVFWVFLGTFIKSLPQMFRSSVWRVTEQLIKSLQYFVHCIGAMALNIQRRNHNPAAGICREDLIQAALLL